MILSGESATDVDGIAEDLAVWFFVCGSDGAPTRRGVQISLPAPLDPHTHENDGSNSAARTTLTSHTMFRIFS